MAVLEMGMNHAGEIRDLCAIARPRIGVVTNVGQAHIEAFDSIEGVAAAKRELIESLPADGVAVLNADDPLVIRFRETHPGRTITFGLGPGADFRAERRRNHRPKACASGGGVDFESSLLGRHNVLNILAGLAVASLFGITPAQLTGVVKELHAPAMRGERILHNGILILNDCYNSNPDAARVMIDVLRETPAQRRIAVLGEMLELGRWSESLHRDVGRYVARSGIDVLVGIRGAASYLVDAAMEAGQAVDAAFFFHEPPQAGDHLRRIARPGDVILLKGSRGTHVERALERFSRRRIKCSIGCSTKSCFASSRRSACSSTSTFRTAFASMTALFLCIALGPWLIAKLREFQIGQYIREEGPKSHMKKAGTPTMGGILIIISIVIPTLLWANLRNAYVWIALFGLVSFGLIGFWDDYAKIRRKQNLGLTVRQKFGLQIVAALIVGFILLLLHAQQGLLHQPSTCRSSRSFKPDLLIDTLLHNWYTYPLAFVGFLRVHDSGDRGLIGRRESHRRPGWLGHRTDDHRFGRDDRPRLTSTATRVWPSIWIWRARPALPS